MDGYKEQTRAADRKWEEAEESLRIALESITVAEKRIKALEAKVAKREKAAFARGRVEAEVVMTRQLPGLYNESFQEGWKALYVWPGSREVPSLPPKTAYPIRTLR